MDAEKRLQRVREMTDEECREKLYLIAGMHLEEYPLTANDLSELFGEDQEEKL